MSRTNLAELGFSFEFRLCGRTKTRKAPTAQINMEKWERNKKRREEKRVKEKTIEKKKEMEGKGKCKIQIKLRSLIKIRFYWPSCCIIRIEIFSQFGINKYQNIEK